MAVTAITDTAKQNWVAVASGPGDVMITALERDAGMWVIAAAPPTLSAGHAAPARENIPMTLLAGEILYVMGADFVVTADKPV